MQFDNNSKAKNASGMNPYNRQLILNLIRKAPVSRADIARYTGLTRAAVTIITDGLVREGLVSETGAGEAAYGRKPILLEINPKAYYTVGLNIARSGCILGVVDLKGNVLARSGFSLKDCGNAYDALNIITYRIKMLIEDLKIPAPKILGIGISAPGPLDVYSGTILNPPDFDMWKEIGIVELMKREFPFRIFLDNNSNALAQAEKNYGAAKEFDSFMLMVVDTGIGAGIIINNRIYRGAGGFGSEIGHTTVNLDGEPCKCGNLGCVEVYASMPSILKFAQSKNKSLTSWANIVDGAISGDSLCREIIDREARYLASGILNALNLFGLEAVILTGDILYKSDMLLNRIKGIVNERLIARDYRRAVICCSSVLRDAQVISSSEIVIEKFFSGELDYLPVNVL